MLVRWNHTPCPCWKLMTESWGTIQWIGSWLDGRPRYLTEVSVPNMLTLRMREHGIVKIIERKYIVSSWVSLRIASDYLAVELDEFRLTQKLSGVSECSVELSAKSSVATAVSVIRIARFFMVACYIMLRDSPCFTPRCGIMDGEKC